MHLAGSQSRLADAIAKHNQQLAKSLSPDCDIEALLLEKSQFIDEILINCWRHFLGKAGDDLCLIATGGFGRGELFPKSDLDILILLGDNPPDTQLLSEFGNYLWDLGLQPGQSVRTIAECLQQAAKDQTIYTCLLELRLISGSQDLFAELRRQFAQKELWSSRKYYAAKMAEQQQRYTKYHDTAYNLEPNIKEGPGGLRDLQNIAWVFKHHYQSTNLKDLISHDFLSAKEYQHLIACRNILWAIRFCLHGLTLRCEDRILFDYQRDLAQQFGFTQDGAPDVEQFMQHYFKTVMELERMNEMLLQLFNENFFDTSSGKQLEPANPHFVSVGNYIEAASPDTFTKHPLALLEIFLLSQQNPQLLGVRASTIRLIRKSLHLIGDDFRADPRAQQLFVAIFQAEQGLTHQLRQMNRYGVLAAYLPCFANIVGRMQYDLFHIHTVDAHTLFVVRNLRRLSLAKHQHELPFCNGVFAHIAKPSILYFAALFHDIAKGLPGDHSQLGETIAVDFCRQHQLPDSDSNLIAWLVRNHLLMSFTAQKKDIDDPAVVHEFALVVGNINYLNHLYLFTVADIRGTNPSLWSSWKDSLLVELYTNTHTALHRGLQNPISRSQQLANNKQEARYQMQRLGISTATVDKTWGKICDDYFVRHSADDITWHTIAIATAKQLPQVMVRPFQRRGSVEVFIYTEDKKAVFSSCALLLDKLNLTILDARIITISTKDKQYALNSFQVLDQTGKPSTTLERQTHIRQTVQKNLANPPGKNHSQPAQKSRQARHFPIASKVHFHPDPQNKYTVLEIITTDRSSLLVLIGQLFTRLNLRLHRAKITTIGSRAEDMFYITCPNSQPISQTQCADLKQQLLVIL